MYQYVPTYILRLTSFIARSQFLLFFFATSNLEASRHPSAPWLGGNKNVAGSFVSWNTTADVTMHIISMCASKELCCISCSKKEHKRRRMALSLDHQHHRPRRRNTLIHSGLHDSTEDRDEHENESRGMNRPSFSYC